MKLKLAAMSAALLCSIPSVASADSFGADVRWTAFSPSDQSVSDFTQEGKTSLGLELALEHPLPFLPNVRAETTSIETSNFKYLSSSATAYYELLDTDIVGLDFGLGLTALSSGKHGKLGNDITKKPSYVEFDSTAAHIYMSAKASMPFHNQLSVYANAYESIGSNIAGHDYKVGAEYSWDFLAVDAVVSAGYRMVSHSIKLIESDSTKTTLETNGLFVSAGVSF